LHVCLSVFHDCCMCQGSKGGGSKVLDPICNISFEVGSVDEWKSGLNLEGKDENNLFPFGRRYDSTLNSILRFDNAVHDVNINT
jgi:hypothetical protein